MGDVSIFVFMNECIEQLRSEGKTQTANSYSSAQRQFSLFSKGKDVSISTIDSELINSFRDYLVSIHVAENTIVYYISALRSIYNKAVKLKITKNRYPFEEVSTKVVTSKYVALNENELNTIKTLDLSDNCTLAFARDMFMLSFYLRGMSYYDMAQLKITDVTNGAIKQTRKDGELVVIDIEPAIREIIERYRSKTMGTDYLLPIITGTKRDSDNYCSAVRLINLKLKKIAKKLNINAPLTSGTARHSWAMIALEKGLSKKLISRCLGYKNEYFSMKYLEDLENTIISNVNRIVINEIRK